MKKINKSNKLKFILPLIFIFIILISLFVFFLVKNKEVKENKYIDKNTGIVLKLKHSDPKINSVFIKKVNVDMDNIIEVYDINLLDKKNNVINVEKNKINISIPYDNTNNYNFFQAVYLDDNNVIKETIVANYDKNNKEILFTVNHLSRYGIIAKIIDEAETTEELESTVSGTKEKQQSEKKTNTKKTITNKTSQTKKETTTNKASQTTKGTTTNSKSKKHSCPNGYILSNDNSYCYRTKDLTIQYNCPDNYTLNGDLTCTGTKVTNAERGHTCPNNSFASWVVSTGVFRCFVNRFDISKEECEAKGYYVVADGGTTACYKDYVEPESYYYNCYGAGYQQDSNDPKKCIKKDTVKSTISYVCTGNYILNEAKDGCISKTNVIIE